MRCRVFRRVCVGILSLSLLVTGMPFCSGGAKTQAAGVQSGVTEKKSVAKEKSGSITVDGNDIRANNVNGLTYKGFGLLSANSTSDLLMDYKAQNPEAYAELLQYLFGGKYPIMTHVKLEMGNDRNNSTGSEASTKRSRYEKANVLRNPGWQLAADAKKINPDIKVSILRWNAPEWVKSIEDVYKWYKATILAAYRQYGYMVDYINPNVNEAWNKKTDVDYTKKFAGWIASENEKTIPDAKERALFQKIKLVVSDEATSISSDIVASMKSDGGFYNAVDVVGYHYTTSDDKNGGMKWLAEGADKEVWNSEAQAVFSNSAFRPSNNVKDPTTEGTGLGGTGSALEMGNTFIKGFVKSRRTHVVYQPAIGSFYEGGQFSFKELVSARDPWSGWIHYDAGLLVLAHLSKFAVTGWENEDNTAGIWRAIPEASNSTASGTNPVDGRRGGENYMTLAAPSKDAFSSVIVNDSEYPMSYQINVKNMKLSDNQKLAVWETRAADDGSFNENYMKCTGSVSSGEDGSYVVKVKPFSVVTVTTLDVADDEEHTKALPVEGERTVLDTDETGDAQDTSNGILYADDFEYTGKRVAVIATHGAVSQKTEDYISSRGGDTGAMARYTHTLNGAFEAYKTVDGNRVLRQQLDQTENGVGHSWNDGDAVTLLGDFRWCNYTASVDVLFENNVSKAYGSVAIRQTGGSQKLEDSSGYTFRVSASGAWKLYRKDKVVLSGTASDQESFKKGAFVWNNLKLKGAGATITAYINNCPVAEYTDENPITSGRIGLGSSYTHTEFDNLRVMKIKGYVPYYTELLDNMETYDLTPEKNTKLVYQGTWSHANGKGMYVYQRSMSETSEAGASLTYSFTGTGMEVLAKTSEAGTVLVSVDGGQPEERKLQKADNMNMSCSVSGLEYKKHTVTIALKEGKFFVDMVGVLGDVCEISDENTLTENWQDKRNNDPTVIPTQTPTPEGPEEALIPDALTTPVPTVPPIVYPTPSPVTPTPQETAPSPVTPAPQETAPSPIKTPTTSGQPHATPVVSGTPDGTGQIAQTQAPQDQYFTSGNATYRIISAKKKTASFVGLQKKNVKAFVIPESVKDKRTGKAVVYRVTAIDKKAFAGCGKLKKLQIKSKKLTSIGKNAFAGIQKKAVISCPSACRKAYRKLITAKTGFKKKTMKILF